VLVLGVATLLRAPNAHGEDWGTTDWQVECIDPPDCAPADVHYAAQLEAASAWLAGLGFEPPASFDNRDLHPGEELRYWIANVSDSDVVKGGLDRAGYYDALEELIWLTSDRYFAMGEAGETHEDPYYQVRASTTSAPVHELFHAIQRADGYWLPTGVAGEWLRESTATAVQLAYARSVASDSGVKFPRRRHDTPLHEPGSKEAGYRTAAFWLFVGEELQSASTIAYLDEMLREEHLAEGSGVRGVDAFLKRYGGLFQLFPRYLARVPFERSFGSVAEWRAALPRGETRVTRHFKGAVRKIAGTAGRLRVSHSSDKAVEVEARFQGNDDDLHLIVDGDVQVPASGGARNVHRKRLDSRSETFDIVVAQVSEQADKSEDREFTLEVEVEEVTGAWVKLDGETFEVEPGICNQAGVVVTPRPDERSIGFTIYAPNGSARVAWGEAGVGASLFPQGCELSSWPPCRPAVEGNAGGPRPAGNPPTRFQVDMDYDLENGIWTGGGHLWSHRSETTVPIEFFIQCSEANRALIR
jgi:hypothetical protein